jgi:quercetin dioxygenase-like cupin family protein
MDKDLFKKELERDNYKIQEKSMIAGTINEDHVHLFDARLFIISGHITIGQNNQKTVYGPGDVCSVAANTLHSEKVGTLMDVTYLAGVKN